MNKVRELVELIKDGGTGMDFETYENEVDRLIIESEAELQEAEKAMEKQTSKNVIEPSEDVNGDIKHYTCPVCEVRHHDYLISYCAYCGQKLKV